MDRACENGSGSDVGVGPYMDKIVGMRISKDGKVFYLLEWKGAPGLEHQKHKETWEPAEKILFPELIEEFEQAVRLIGYSILNNNVM